MNARMLAIALLTLVAVAGCRTNPHRYAAVRDEELRLLEDRIYELEDLVARYQQALMADGTIDGGGPAVTRPSAQAAPTGSPTTAPPPPATKEIPRVEMPGLPMAPGKIPERLKSPAGTARPPANTPPATPAKEEGKDASRLRGAWRVGAGSQRVAKITLNQLFTGGYDADGQPGDEGVTASIEPRDAEGRLVPAAAPISVVLLDPSQQGEAARVARWDFSAEEIAAMSQDARLSQGIHLAMTWPGKPPKHGHLEMFVRYTTADGRKLEVNKPVDVDVAGRQARRWTPVTPTAPSTVARRVSPAPRRTSPPESPAPRSPARVAARPARREPIADAPQRARPSWSPYRR